MKEIPLTQNQFAIVDDGYWFDYLNQWKWQARWAENTQSYYAIRSEGWRDNKKTILMSRVVAQTPDGMICDHINHNTLDNRESELRNVTPMQSNMNRKVFKNNKLGVKGVSKKGNIYNARLSFQGKDVLDKNYPTIEEAIQARKEAEEKYFGIFSL